MFLSHEEVIELTHKRNRKSQVEALRKMGINHFVRPDGSIAILRAYIEKAFSEGHNVTNSKKKFEPDWSMLNAKKTQH